MNPLEVSFLNCVFLNLKNLWIAILIKKKGKRDEFCIGEGTCITQKRNLFYIFFTETVAHMYRWRNEAKDLANYSTRIHWYPLKLSHAIFQKVETKIWLKYFNQSWTETSQPRTIYKERCLFHNQYAFCSNIHLNIIISKKLQQWRLIYYSYTD